MGGGPRDRDRRPRHPRHAAAPLPRRRARDRVPKLPLAVTSVALTLWLVEVFVSTFRAPFLTTGNGYFASWAGLVAAAYVCKPHLPKWMQAKVARARQSVKNRVMDAREKTAARGARLRHAVMRAQPRDTETPAPPPPRAPPGDSSIGHLQSGPRTSSGSASRSQRQTRSAMAGSPFLLTSAGDDAESHVWPLVAALGEQQTKAATLLSALAEQQQKSRDLEQQLEAAHGGSPRHREGAPRATDEWRSLSRPWLPFRASLQKRWMH